MTQQTRNIDPEVIAAFGDEWSRFDQSVLDDRELESLAAAYFSVFPWSALPAAACGFDLGCGSGRWARFVAPRIGTLHCVEPSATALAVARRNLRDMPNVRFHLAAADNIPLADSSQDFAYSLGVLHHLPDPAAGLRSMVAKVKPGAPVLVYVYYALENRPAWFRRLWRASDHARRAIARAPAPVRYALSEAIALLVYLPLARTARALEVLGVDVDNLPLSAYRRHSFYVMRTDALDRFGTGLERRFTRDQLLAMMQDAGLHAVSFREAAPYWCAVGRRGPS